MAVFEFAITGYRFASHSLTAAQKRKIQDIADRLFAGEGELPPFNDIQVIEVIGYANGTRNLEMHANKRAEFVLDELKLCLRDRGATSTQVAKINLGAPITKKLLSDSQSTASYRKVVIEVHVLAHEELSPGATIPAAVVQQWLRIPDPFLDAGCHGGAYTCTGTADSRTPVLNTVSSIPNRWICSIHLVHRDPVARSGWTFHRCSGVAIGNGLILTAAHCLVNQKKVGTSTISTSAEAAAIVFGRQGLINPWVLPDGHPAGIGMPLSSFGAMLVKGSSNFWVAPEWSAAISKGEDTEGNVTARAFDYGVIRLAGAVRIPTVTALGHGDPFWPSSGPHATIANTSGFWNDLQLEHQIAMAGYPGDKPCTQWGSVGPVKDLHSIGTARFKGMPKHGWVEARMDAAGGMSGSPIWRKIHGGQDGPLLEKQEKLVMMAVLGSCRVDIKPPTGMCFGALLTPFVWERLSKI